MRLAISGENRNDEAWRKARSFSAGRGPETFSMGPLPRVSYFIEGVWRSRYTGMSWLRGVWPSVTLELRAGASSSLYVSCLRSGQYLQLIFWGSDPFRALLPLWICPWVRPLDPPSCGRGYEVPLRLPRESFPSSGRTAISSVAKAASSIAIAMETRIGFCRP